MNFISRVDLKYQRRIIKALKKIIVADSFRYEIEDAEDDPHYQGMNWPVAAESFWFNGLHDKVVGPPTDEYILSSSIPLFRGLKNIDITKFEKIAPLSKPDRSAYGQGVYTHLSALEASKWIQQGLIIKYMPKKSLLLFEYKLPQRQQDLMKIPRKYDGVYLSSHNQEAGRQIILKNGSLIQPIGYWDITTEDMENNYNLHMALKSENMKKI